MPLADVLLRLVTDEPISRDERWELAVLILQLLRAHGVSTGQGTMALSPSDFTLSDALIQRCRAVLAVWDARDPWTDNGALEKQLLDVMTSVTAPRIMMLPSSIHVAKFLREIVERAEGDL